MDKKERNKKITSLTFGKQGKTYKEIADKFGISPQRVYEIARREMFRNARSIKAWAVLENGELSSSPGSLMLYYIFPEKHLEEIKEIFKDRKKFKIIPCNINY